MRLSVDLFYAAPARVLGTEQGRELYRVDLDLVCGYGHESDLVSRFVEPQFVAPGDKVFAASPDESGPGEIEIEDLEGMICVAGDLHSQVDFDPHRSFHHDARGVHAESEKIEMVLEPLTFVVEAVQPAV